MKATVYDLTGTKVKDITLDKDIFEAKINPTLMAQVIRVYQSNQRLGNAKTLTRGEIDRTTKKVYRQKGTGNARHGSRKAPIYVGGGIAHGPRGNQNYSLKLTQKMKSAALKSALSQKATDQKIIIVEGLDSLKAPKTQKLVKFLEKTVSQLRNISVVLESDMQNAIKSLTNIPYVDSCNSHNLTTYKIIKARTLILSQQSLVTLKERLTK